MDKIEQAKRLVASLETDFDFDCHLIDHPNTESARRRLAEDIAGAKSQDYNTKDKHGSIIHYIPSQQP